MTATFKIGDRVSWNFEFGHTSGVIKAVYTSPFEAYGRSHHASSKEPQFEVESEKTGHFAIHKASALTKLDGKSTG